jgi:glycosyltransferase involved in cell wall biosynthesis
VGKPRVLLVAYLPSWSYDWTAQAMVRHLSHRFEFRIAYRPDVEAFVRGEPDGTHWIDASWPDVVVDMWWHGTMHHHFGRKVVKQISSHRWSQRKWGRYKPSNVLETYARGAGEVIVPSRRLLEMFQAVESEEPHTISLAQKGFEPGQFSDHGMRRGEQLTVGWAGIAEGPDKHVRDLVEALPTIRLADDCLTYSEMPDFYNSLDVIAIASEAEGDPRPLIEGMACGCFPVTSDVGIAPELIRNGDNGIILPERGPEYFRDAFAWCRENIDHVRRAGAANAREMRGIRTWAHVMPAWGDVFDRVLELNRQAA